MLLNAIAIIILAGMMLVPLVNILVGAIAGAGLAGPPGAVAGVALAIAITGAEKLIGDHRLKGDAADLDLGERSAFTGRPARHNPERQDEPEASSATGEYVLPQYAMIG